MNAGQTTVLSVVNTTNLAKAVKVRFLEGYNSQEVLDFNLFLSAYDVWTANVFALSATGGGNVLTGTTRAAPTRTCATVRPSCRMAVPTSRSATTSTGRRARRAWIKTRYATSS